METSNNISNDIPAGITSASQALPPSPSDSGSGGEGVRGKKGAVYSSIGGIIPTPTATAATATASNDVNLLTAYFLYFLFGLFGIHHAYLHRPNQGLAWYASGGLFGWGLFRDFLRLPEYVSLARDKGLRDDANNVTARIRDATVQARNGIPKMSLARIILMGAFGTYFGFIASCLVYLPVVESGSSSSTGALYGTLRAIGAAAGIWLVGNMGDQMIMTSPGGGDVGREFTNLVAWCIGGFAVAKNPVFGGIIYAVRRRRYRPSMSSPKATTGKRSPSSASARIGRHLLTCATFTALLALAAYNHGSVTVNGGRKVYLHEAIRNAYGSKFWEEFDRTQFHGRGGDGGEYLKKAFDLQGERAARRTLGVKGDAPHSEVRSAYKKLALKYHPDKYGLNFSDREVLEAQGNFVKLHEAYEVLNDIEQRRKKKEGGAGRGPAH